MKEALLALPLSRRNGSHFSYRRSLLTVAAEKRVADDDDADAGRRGPDFDDAARRCCTTTPTDADRQTPTDNADRREPYLRT